jgi:aspartate aminotransferase
LTYNEQIHLADARDVIIDTSATGFVPTKENMESALSKKTVGIIINSPNNPTGAVYDMETLEMLADLARQNDLWIIFDEIYERLVYGGAKHYNILQIAPDLRDRVIIINGVSKAYSMTGWRIGYALGPKEAIAKMDDIQSHLSSNPSSIAQWAAVGAIEGGESYVENNNHEFERRRDLLVDLLSGLPGLRLDRSDGAFYALIDVRNSSVPDDKEFCRRILEEKFVALIPGDTFRAPGYVRMSYACSEADIREGAARIKEFLRR